MGSNFKHPEMVFTSATGNYKDRSSLNTSLKRFLKGTGSEYMTLHTRIRTVELMEQILSEQTPDKHQLVKIG